jgi:CheY-like chemotaxis protein
MSEQKWIGVIENDFHSSEHFAERYQAVRKKKELSCSELGQVPGPVDVPPAEALTGLRVLVVDDLALNREIMNRQLAAMGAEALLAPDGPTALAILQKSAAADSPVRVILMDGQLAQVRGIDVARQIRALAEVPRAPILLCSSGTSLGREQPENGLVDAMLLKPILPARLREGLLMAVAPPAPPPVSGPAPQIEEGPRRKILLVEDNATNQIVMKTILSRANCQVDVAPDGSIAVSMAQGQPYDVILMDLQMPVMDGLEATRKIRGMPNPNRRTRIIGLTAAAGPVFEAQCRAAGMDDYLSKPVQRAALLERLGLTLT